MWTRPTVIELGRRGAVAPHAVGALQHLNDQSFEGSRLDATGNIQLNTGSQEPMGRR